MLRHWVFNVPIIKMFIAKLSSLILSFIVAICIGVNSLAYLSYITKYEYHELIIIASFIGALVLGSSSIMTIGHKIYGPRYLNALGALITASMVTIIATLFRVPISVSYITVTSLIGASIGSHLKLIAYGTAIKLLLIQIVSIPLALIAGIMISMFTH